MTEYFEKEAPRIETMVSRFLAPMLDRQMEILSVGCGAGADVIKLRRMGYSAFGLDPSRLSLEAIPAEYRPFFQVGTAEEYVAANNKQYDFIYALDVIEHVGCKNFGTSLDVGSSEARKLFLESCFRALKPGGTLVLTTSNRLCPIDIGHWHNYHWLGRRKSGRRKFGLSIPWDSRNFLVSGEDVRRLMMSFAGKKASFGYVKTAEYPTLRGRKALLRLFLRFVDLPFLIGSPLAPILIVRITKEA